MTLKRYFKFRQLILLTAIAITCVYMTYSERALTPFEPEQDRRISRAKSGPSIKGLRPSMTSSKKGWKTILFWTGFWGSKRYIWKKIFKRLVFEECEENRCILTTKIDQIAKADAVVFNGNDMNAKFKFPFDLKPEQRILSRREDQMFVFFTLEPPPGLSQIKLEDYDNFFNWTMTYRRDSDIVIPYGKVTKRILKKPKSETKHYTNSELKKKKMAIWMASHCKTQSRREDFVRELNKHMSVDSYGSCGTKTCGTRTTIPYVDKIGSDPCDDLIGNYSFYLAFENALCNDYVTEKLYRSLILDIIPVVFGAVNYAHIAPPKSFIDFRDFESISELADYLRLVVSDSKLYNGYLKWQEDYEVEVGSPYKPFVCDLCKKLHQKTKSERKIYSSIKDWFKKETCYRPLFS